MSHIKFLIHHKIEVSDIYISDDKIEEEIPLCDICHNLAISPQNIIPCTHIICLPCRLEHPTLKVCVACDTEITKFQPLRKHALAYFKPFSCKCPNHKMGCKAVMSFPEVEDHLQRCLHTLLRCSACRASVVRQRSQYHLKEECPRRVVLCKYCPKLLAFEDMDEHLDISHDTCSGCKGRYNPEDSDQHLPEPCPICNEEVRVCMMGQHFKDKPDHALSVIRMVQRLQSEAAETKERLAEVETKLSATSASHASVERKMDELTARLSALTSVSPEHSSIHAVRTGDGIAVTYKLHSCFGVAITTPTALSAALGDTLLEVDGEAPAELVLEDGCARARIPAEWNEVVVQWCGHVCRVNGVIAIDPAVISRKPKTLGFSPQYPDCHDGSLAYHPSNVLLATYGKESDNTGNILHIHKLDTAEHHCITLPVPTHGSYVFCDQSADTPFAYVFEHADSAHNAANLCIIDIVNKTARTVKLSHPHQMFTRPVLMDGYIYYCNGRQLLRWEITDGITPSEVIGQMPNQRFNLALHPLDRTKLIAFVRSQGIFEITLSPFRCETLHAYPNYSIGANSNGVAIRLFGDTLGLVWSSNSDGDQIRFWSQATGQRDLSIPPLSGGNGHMCWDSSNGVLYYQSSKNTFHSSDWK
eukprot:gnl/Dysnectes_brevis/5304_a7561_390.p1 GENE.gnl/Dysnectes_brevis/5304_a7561_390~~gnl/Dysnectes_brevis/5304_a7561_390.p1  ORF type:complete len:643 (+),score=75.44 gnl/Dysnectes_brevis/5304_a7561_390:40-1968(+)